MATHPAALWTLDDLSARVALALATDYLGAPNGRVRDVPDRRTIRYYTTLGLLDRPAEMRGRTALYARRHLLQLVAIKRLQAKGLSLAEVQQRLVGLPDSRLAALAQLPHDAGAPAATPAPSGRRREAFWAALPDQAAAENGVATVTAPCPLPSALQAISLAAGVTLLLPAVRPVDSDDLEAITAAAAPLLKLLEKRRLLDPHPERNTP